MNITADGLLKIPDLIDEFDLFLSVRGESCLVTNIVQCDNSNPLVDLISPCGASFQRFVDGDKCFSIKVKK